MSMTKEEAIAFLSRYVDNEYYTPQCQEAHRMAIEAIREREERRWVPVTERLPELEGTYLTYSERGSITTRHFYTEKHFANGYVREACWSQLGKVKVTHWMPLPEPPKEVNE